MRIFAPDGKLAGTLNRIGDLIILNLLTIICCIPIITIGASMTALYSVTLKMAKNEEGKVVSGFFNAFRENFKQATILWLIGGGTMVLLAADIYVCRYIGGTPGMIMKGSLLALLVFVAMIVMYLFPVLARFENTTKNTAKNAALFSMSHFFKSLLMLAANLIPIAVLAISMRFVIVDVLVGLSGIAFLTSLYYRHVFGLIEEKQILNN